MRSTRAGQPIRAVDMTEHSAISFPFDTNRPGWRYGEWETIGDRIERRDIWSRDILFNQQYRISRNYEGEIFTCYGEIPPEVLDSVTVDQFNMILRNIFFGAMMDAIEKRDGSWVEKK